MSTLALMFSLLAASAHAGSAKTPPPPPPGGSPGKHILKVTIEAGYQVVVSLPAAL